MADESAATSVLPAGLSAGNVRDFDLRALPHTFFIDPYPTYHALRAHDPVRAMPDGSWFLTRHADVTAVYRDPRLFSSDKQAEFAPVFGDSPLFAHHTTSLVFNDPPLHTNVRGLIAGALTQRAVAALAPALARFVDGLLDRAAERGTMDVIADYADAIPIEIIGNLLGVPAAERGPLRGWSLAILGALEPAPDARVLAAGNAAVSEFLAYLRDLVAARRAAPGDPATDVLTRLIGGEDRAAGARLSEPELLHNCIFILNAGHETTTNLIGNGLHALLRWPDERARLLADPALIDGAVEEFLRYESSNQLGNRISTGPAEIGGARLPAGSRITLCIGAANRDPAVFAVPDRLDIARTPNRHLAFGFGIHQCAGMSLARLEARVAILHFVRRFPRAALAGAPVHGGRARFRGFLSLPVRLA
jgi:cytochrome P450